MPRHLPLPCATLALTFGLLAGCAPIPEVDAHFPPSDAPPPRLLPASELPSAKAEPRAEAAAGQLEARAARLRARAAALRGTTG